MIHEFKNYNDIVKYINNYDKSIKITKQSISNLKNRKLIQKQIPKNEDTLRFINYLKIKFPNFNDDYFFTV
jgi:hypothetical protein